MEFVKNLRNHSASNSHQSGSPHPITNGDLDNSQNPPLLHIGMEHIQKALDEVYKTPVSNQASFKSFSSIRKNLGPKTASQSTLQQKQQKPLKSSIQSFRSTSKKLKPQKKNPKQHRHYPTVKRWYNCPMLGSEIDGYLLNLQPKFRKYRFNIYELNRAALKI